MKKRKLAILLAWKNFSEYYSNQLAEAIKDYYETIITYKWLDWDKFDIVMPFFPQVRLKCSPRKVIKCLWEPHEFGWAGDAGVVLASCTTVHDQLKGKYKNLHLVRWGVNLEHFMPQPFPMGKIRIGWAGLSDNPRKLFPALKACIESMSDVEFYPNLARMWQGEVFGDYDLETMWRYYEQIHVYACGSANEGFGFPLLEASACGRPVVTFDVGVSRDLRDTGAGVIIVNGCEEMQEAIRGIDYRSLGVQSTQAVHKHWLWPYVTDKWLEVLALAG